LQDSLTSTSETTFWTGYKVRIIVCRTVGTPPIPLPGYTDLTCEALSLSLPSATPARSRSAKLALANYQFLTSNNHHNFPSQADHLNTAEKPPNSQAPIIAALHPPRSELHPHPTSRICMLQTSSVRSFLSWPIASTQQQPMAALHIHQIRYTRLSPMEQAFPASPLLMLKSLSNVNDADGPGRGQGCLSCQRWTRDRSAHSCRSI
jgi:hypothetical protein